MVHGTNIISQINEVDYVYHVTADDSEYVWTTGGELNGRY